MATPLTEEELEAAVSATSMDGYRRAPSGEKSKILLWVPTLWEMSDEEFVLECASRILDSAIMNRWRWNAWGVHARTDICADEAGRRHRMAGHTPNCSGGNLYSEGLNLALRNQGHQPSPTNPCTCGRDK